MIVTDAASGLRDILHSALVSTLDIVAEGEESVRPESHFGVLCDPRFLLLTGERLGLTGKELLPCSIAQHIVGLFGEIHIDGIVAVGASDILLERQLEHFGALSHPPFIGLASCQSGAVDAALLTRSDTDSLPVFHIAHTVALCVFQCDERDFQVAQCLGSERFVLCGDIFEECGVVEIHLVATLFKGHPKHLLVLYGLGRVVGVYLDDTV